MLSVGAEQLHFIICIAGLPQEAVNEVQAIPGAVFTGAKDNVPILKPLRPPYGYRHGMSDYYLGEIAKRVEKFPPSHDVGVALAYAKHSSGSEDFVRNFFPFAAVAPFTPIFPDAFERRRRHSELLNCVTRVQAVVTRLREQIAVMRDRLSGQIFSPLTLPLQNFRSGVVEGAMFDLFNSLWETHDMRARIEQCCRSITEVHPVLRKPEWSRERFFEDARELRFKSPGSDRHGMARVVAASHLPSCLIKGRVRLGGPIDALFHYDCEYERGELDAVYPNCHGLDTAPSKRTHVNIAPSDAIR